MLNPSASSRWSGRWCVLNPSSTCRWLLAMCWIQVLRAGGDMFWTQVLLADDYLLCVKPKYFKQVVTWYVLNPSSACRWLLAVLNPSSSSRWSHNLFWTQVLLAGGYMIYFEHKFYLQVIACFVKPKCFQQVVIHVLNQSSACRWLLAMCWTQKFRAGGHMMFWTQFLLAGGDSTNALLAGVNHLYGTQVLFGLLCLKKLNSACRQWLGLK